jgi:thiol-disulfide isomerase/thioredoxin
MMRFASYPIVRAAASIAVGMSLICSAASVQAKDAPEGQVVGFENAQGKVLFLHDFKGKPVLINLWATWCIPCVEEMPSLSKLQQQYASKGLVVIALSEDDALSSAAAFYQKAGITNLAPYLDKGHVIWAALQARGIPTSVLITPNGDMVQRIEGPVDWQSAKVQSIVAQILK